MAITTDDFEKIWASTSPLTPYEFSESNYKEGWNFIGSTPPSRQMWDAFMQNADEKAKFLYELAQMLVPVGVVQSFAGTTVPDGWLLCDGSEVSRTDYAELFAVIGTTYGDGDGSTTFDLPNMANRFIEGGLSSGTYIGAGLPNITGKTITYATSNYSTSIPSDVPSGAFAYDSSQVATLNGGTTNTMVIGAGDMDASRSNSIYGNSNTVQPNALVMQYIIKY